jgi:putative endonuclease
MPETSYVVYLLECADGTLYTGVTTDIARRLAEHNEGEKGAKYTRARRPVKVVYEETCASRSEAQKREAEIRKLSRAAKLVLAQG